MPSLLLTPQNVTRLPPVKGRHTDYLDTFQRGLELRVTPAGSRSYAVTYYRGRRHRRFTIGKADKVTLKQAREQARLVLARATMGEDPQAEKMAALEADTVKGLGDAFLGWTKARVRPKTYDLWNGILKHRVYPTLGTYLANDVVRADVRRLVEGIATEAPIMANRTLALVRRVFAWGVGRDMVRGSPCLGIEMPAAEEASDRVLSRAELHSLMAALVTTNDESADVVWLLLYTGVRLRMVLGMKAEELEHLAEPRRALWTVPGGYHGRSKNRRAHQVPLVPQAVAIIERRRAVRGTSLLFPNFADRRKPMTWRSAFVARLCRNMEKLHEEPVPAWTVHNLRHSMRTHLREQLRVGDDVAELILGHTRPGVQGVYNRAALLEERRAALVAWADWLGRIRSGEVGNMVAFGRKQ